MKRIITAEEISKNLPMRVKSLAKNGMFGEIEIRFDKVRNEPDKDWHLSGKSLDSTKSIIILDPKTEFETIV